MISKIYNPNPNPVFRTWCYKLDFLFLKVLLGTKRSFQSPFKGLNRTKTQEISGGKSDFLCLYSGTKAPFLDPGTAFKN